MTDQRPETITLSTVYDYMIGMNSRLVGLEQRMDRLEAKFDEVLSIVRSLAEGQQATNERLDRIEATK